MEERARKEALARARARVEEMSVVELIRVEVGGMSVGEKCGLTALLSMIVLLITFLIYLGWFWAIGLNQATVDTRICLLPHATPDASLPCTPHTVHIYPNGGNNTGSPNDALTLVFSPCNTTLFALAHLGWEGLGADKASPPEVRAYSGVGIQMCSIHDLLESGYTSVTSPGTLRMFLVHASDYWFWPGLYVGHVARAAHILSPTSGKPVEIETLALEPRLFVIRDFVSLAEAGRIISTANSSLARSQVLDTDGDGSSESAVSTVRTSSQTWLGWWWWNAMGSVRTRIEKLTSISDQNGERLQVIRYTKDQHYHAHHDYFDPDIHIHRKDLASGRNRMITVLFYLSNVTKGGETYFPRAHPPLGVGRSTSASFTDCGSALTVPPSPGDAIMFYSMHPIGAPDGVLDMSSLHGGCDVVEGVKWGANVWLNNRREFQLVP